MKYIKKFDEHSDYADFRRSENYVTPNVSYCLLEDELHYNPAQEDKDYSQEYFTIEALEEGNVLFTYDANEVPELVKYMEYSKDGGETWNRTNNESGQINVMTIPMSSGDIALVRGENGGMASLDYGVSAKFTIESDVNVYGNIMSLLYADDFIGQDEIDASFTLTGLFRECSIVDAGNLVLPAMTLSSNCYTNMFYGCTSLTTAPELLPATTLAGSCYDGMFYGCTSLTTVPELPATTLANDCYNHMFYNCTSLTSAPELPATTLVSNCYDGMFYGCTSLTSAPELPATTLVSDCYCEMFNGCTNLNYIKAMFTTEPSDEYTDNWVGNVAASGTFVKNSAATWNVTGTDGIPSGWTVQTASE